MALTPIKNKYFQVYGVSMVPMSCIYGLCGRTSLIAHGGGICSNVVYQRVLFI